MSTQRVQGMLLFLVLVVNSARVRILHSYTLLLPTYLYSYLPILHTGDMLVMQRFLTSV